jgi:hypothetical protein
MKMPLAFADQFYVLREHIGFVRQRLAHAPVAQADQAPTRNVAQPDASGVAARADTEQGST